MDTSNKYIWKLKQAGWGHYYILEDETGNEVYSLEAPQMLIISGIFELPLDVQKAIFDKAKELGNGQE
jgi:hypothetical protein